MQWGGGGDEMGKMKGWGCMGSLDQVEKSGNPRNLFLGGRSARVFAFSRRVFLHHLPPPGEKISLYLVIMIRLYILYLCFVVSEISMFFCDTVFYDDVMCFVIFC